MTAVTIHWAPKTRVLGSIICTTHHSLLQGSYYNSYFSNDKAEVHKGKHFPRPHTIYMGEESQDSNLDLILA